MTMYGSATRKTLALAALALAIGVGGATSASAYWISPYFTSDTNPYYFPDPGCNTRGDIEPTFAAVYETTGTCTSSIGVRIVTTTGATHDIAWGATYSAYSAVALGGSTSKYKIYHRDANGN
jgi:hypothetical protein